METNGWSLNIGKSENDGKFKIQIKRMKIANPKPQIDNQDCWLGLRLDFVYGPLVLPVAKMYHWKFWQDDPTYSQQWNNGNHWFSIKIPVFFGPFLSIMLGKWKFGVPGFYIGLRTADLSNPIDYQLRLDWNKSEYDHSAWAWDSWGNPIEAWPVGKYKGKKTVEISMAIRSDFTH